MKKTTKNQDIEQDNVHKADNQVEENQDINTSEEQDVSLANENESSTNTNDDVEELTPEEKLQNELNLQKDKYVRLFAEFENYKRRTSKERMELYKTAGQDVMQSLLPVLDDFERALKEVKKTEDDELIKGVELISNKLSETLKSKGLYLMNVNSGDVFDADIHEAITQIPAPSDELKGKIVDVIEKGYTLGDKIIRYPKVVTGK